MLVLLICSVDYSVVLVVDNLIGFWEVVVKLVGLQLVSVVGISGVIIFGDGVVVIIFDIYLLICVVQVQQVVLLKVLEVLFVELEMLDYEYECCVVLLVMVVDDLVMVCKVIGCLLECSGFDVIIVKDGIDVIVILEEYIFVVMLLDIEMFCMDGFEVVIYVCYDECFKDVLIIMIILCIGEKYCEWVFDIGVNCYLGKLFQESELLVILCELFGEIREISQ